MLTLEEQERRAYISGDTDRAALLARAIDSEAAGAPKIRKLQAQIDNYDDEVQILEDDIESLREQVEDLGGVPCA